MNKTKLLLERYIKKAIREKLEEEANQIRTAEKSLYLIYRFPGLKNAIEQLLTPSFKRYINKVEVVAPKPTMFRVELVNGLDFHLIYAGKQFVVKVSGKKYDLAQKSAYDRACTAISNLLAMSPMKTEEAEGGKNSSGSNSGGSSSGGNNFGGGGSSTSSDSGAEAFADLAADLENTPDSTPGSSNTQQNSTTNKSATPGEEEEDDNTPAEPVNI
jgi:hypothetical protein